MRIANLLWVFSAALALSFALASREAPAQPADSTPSPESAALSPEQQAFVEKLKQLHWQSGPAEVHTVGSATIHVPDDYVYLDQGETRKFLELNQNLANGREVTIAPKSLRWSGYLDFTAGGYVKDDEKIDAAALLKQLQENTESSNAARKDHGYPALHVTGWAEAPTYNASTKRLEWATQLQSDSGTGVNYFTKVLGRRGFTTAVLVADPAQLAVAGAEFNRILGGYNFDAGETYGDYRPGDKVAEYGLAALILGGAAAVATKKGLWAVLGTLIVGAWKIIVAVVVGLGAWAKRLLTRKPAG